MATKFSICSVSNAYLLRRRRSGSTRTPATVSCSAAVATRQPRPSLARVWREIQGANDWRDLVAPLHPLLRAEIVRYGELVNTCYEAFDPDPTSGDYLDCKHDKTALSSDTGYEITKFIYAGPGRSRWMGYVAVSSDTETRRLGRRDVVVAFRGTVTASEWLANLMSSLRPARLDPVRPRPEVKVEEGFLSVYTSPAGPSRLSCREQLLRELARLVEIHRTEEMSVTLAGHSMGSSLAILAGYDLAEIGLNRGITSTVYSFAGPRVGNAGFKARCEELGVKVLRVVNVNDPVTKLPGVFLNENLRAWCNKHALPWSFSCYSHVGVELALDFFMMRDPACVHDLGVIISLLRSPEIAKKREDKREDLLEKAVKLLSANNLDKRGWLFK
ncbi:phospholipase A1-Ialpha2, chloroplastic-like [Wolffia australiana]